MESNLPTHVAIIPDGNRRWSERHGLSRFEGHQAGAQKMYEVVDALLKRGIKYITVWGFSTDNWKRNPGEVSDIFNLLKQWIDSHAEWAHSKGIRLRHLGGFLALPEDLRESIRKATSLTRNNMRMTLNVAFNYSGRAEIIGAVRQLMIDSVPGELVDEQLFGRYLYTGGMPDVDLVIRTAGDFRISNFLLWQTAYSEFYFTKTLWPDFNAIELGRALEIYCHRRRRFGGD